MLHRFAFSNFHSFLEHTEVSLALNGKVPRTNWERDASFGAERLSTVLAVVGPNGAGKTNVLRPLLFLAHFMASSFSDHPEGPIALLEPHFSAPDQASEFEFEFSHAERLYRYELKATRMRVIREALFEKHSSRAITLFTREWKAHHSTYDLKLSKLDFPLSMAKLVRANASLLSTAAQWGAPIASELSKLLQCNQRMATSLVGSPSDAELFAVAKHFAQTTEQKERMTQLLRTWDFGLSDVGFIRTEDQGQSLWHPMGQHKLKDGNFYFLPFSKESSGTQTAFVLLKPLLNALRYGQLAIIDELESGLHPHMLEPILTLFADPTVNLLGAQLLFTTHSMQVLNLLHKSRVMLVEKDEYGESTSWRMDSVKGIRNDDNLYAKYMAGAYGAVPQL